MQLTSLIAAIAVTSRLAAGHMFAERIPASTALRTRDTAGPERGCGNENPPEYIVEQMSRIAANDNKYSRVQAAEDGVSRCDRTIFVKTWIHAAVPESAPDNYLNKAILQRQIDELNRAYNPHDVVFVSEGFTRTVSDSISRLSYFMNNDTIAGTNNPDLEAHWKKYRTGDYQTMHIWLYDSVEGGSLLGVATFPWTHQKEEEKWLDGVHVLSNTLPGGNSTAYNQGKTAVHEAGHWLGLFHVFDDETEGCDGKGDLVSDTPKQGTRTYRCPPDGVKDSCPGFPGLDSIHNYMDYSDDRCLTEFTEGQESRIHNVWAEIRGAVSW